MQLHQYQIEGIQYALKHRNTLIADEMGLGKTVQAIGYINANSEIRSVLIVCPRSLKLNWWNEIDEWLDCKERCTINIVHYEALKKIVVPFVDLLIVDEAQYIKNAKTERHQQVKAISKRAKHTIMLTGTPFENKVIELWPLLQILKPETWDSAGMVSKSINGKKTRVKVAAGEGAGFFTFAKRYCGAKKVVMGTGARTKIFWDFSGATNLDELKEWLNKTGMIRRLKADVLSQLPPKRRQVISFPNAHHFSDVDSWEINEGNFEEAIAQLTSSKVAFTEWSKKRIEQGLAKVEYIIEHVQRAIENGVEKIILFAHHKEVILELAKNLVFVGCTYMTSDMPVQDRQDAVETFNDDPNCKVIIGSFGTMGTGFTMTVSDTVMFAEIDPVPGKMLQAEDRAHRFGQEKVVWVHYLVFDNTLEARICKILVKKQGIMKQVLG